MDLHLFEYTFVFIGVDFTNLDHIDPQKENNVGFDQLLESLFEDPMAYRIFNSEFIGAQNVDLRFDRTKKTTFHSIDVERADRTNETNG